MPVPPPAINSEIKYFNSGVYNLLDDSLIPADAASDEKNWYVQDGRIKLIPGRQAVGTEGASGMITGEIFGYKIDGSQVHYRKVGATIQSCVNGINWVNVISGNDSNGNPILTASADYSFTNYSSLAGAFTFAIGVDGIFKFVNANPTSYINLTNTAKNWGGHAFIDQGRMILWARVADKTGIYGSHIDPQNSTVYTTVTGEATTTLAGTLAFKAGGATRNCFGVVITLSGTGEVYTDDYLGNLVGKLNNVLTGNKGTINYVTGAYTIPVAGTGNYSNHCGT